MNGKESFLIPITWFKLYFFLIEVYSNEKALSPLRMVYFTNTSAGIIQASIYVTQLPVELPKSMANATPTSMQILVSVLFQSEQHSSM